MDEILRGFNRIIEYLNNYAGLFSLLAVLAAIFVPCIIFKKERNEERKALQDELDSIEEISHFSMSQEDRRYFTRRNTLGKRLKKK